LARKKVATGVESFMVLRFRDLVTEPGGTITEHLRVLRDRGRVWWGWWMRPQENEPRDLLASLYRSIEGGAELPAFLFDTGQTLLHTCSIADIRLAPEGETIGSPDLDASPAYYHRGRYPAWFRLSQIEPNGIGTVPGNWIYAEFPTKPERVEHEQLRGKRVDSLDQLRNTDATLWLIRVT
jgi:hypothetical protein